MRKVSSPSTDYTGELDGEWSIRITDKLSGRVPHRGRHDDHFPDRFPGPLHRYRGHHDRRHMRPCDDRGRAHGRHGPEGARSNWQIGEIDLNDGGPDGIASTQDNGRFAVQGIFVP